MLQSARSRGHRVAVFLVTVLALVLAPVLAPMRQAWAKAATPIPDPQRIEVPGYPDAFYYRPRVRGMRPVIMYLHGRGGNPMEECRKWAKVATQFGWVVCPQGPVDKGGGARAWDNNAIVGGQIADATVKALRAKYKRRVQLHGNVLIGFSEGAFVAMQVAIHDTRTWSRWLILAANDQYWWGDAPGLLDDNRKKVRIYLFTGETDAVVENTKRVGDMLKAHKMRYKMKIATGMGHEVPADRMVTNYRRPLSWLLATK